MVLLILIRNGGILKFIDIAIENSNTMHFKLEWNSDICLRKHPLKIKHHVHEIHCKSDRFNVNGSWRRESIIGFLCNLVCRKCIWHFLSPKVSGIISNWARKAYTSSIIPRKWDVIFFAMEKPCMLSPNMKRMTTSNKLSFTHCCFLNNVNLCNSFFFFPTVIYVVLRWLEKL